VILTLRPGFIPEEIVVSAFVSLRIKGHAEQLRPMVKRIEDEISIAASGASGQGQPRHCIRSPGCRTGTVSSDSKAHYRAKTS